MTGRQKFRHDTPTEDTAPERCIRKIGEQEHLPLTSQGEGMTDFMLDDLPIEVHGPQHNDPTQERHDDWKASQLVARGYREPLWLPDEWCNMKYRKYLLRLLKQPYASWVANGRKTIEIEHGELNLEAAFVQGYVVGLKEVLRFLRGETK